MGVGGDEARDGDCLADPEMRDLFIFLGDELSKLPLSTHIEEVDVSWSQIVSRDVPASREVYSHYQELSKRSEP